VEIDLSGSNLTYEVGDALGVYPTNCPELVEQILAAIDLTPKTTFEVDGKSLPVAEAVREHFCLREIPDELISLLADRCPDPQQSETIRGLLTNAESIDGYDVLDLLHQYPFIRLTAAELLGTLARLKPRLYSISSSLRAHPGQVHLTVGRVGWSFRDRARKGVASTMFADRLGSSDTVRIFVQRAHGFSIPHNPDSPMIMIGPGTGIAPFRAFLQERRATRSQGKNWLFFGDQRAATDFLYQDELQALIDQQVLTRLDVAFSRDQEQKIYVQDRMLEHGAELWSWLQQGGHVYVCGDAKRMAVDVDRTLRKIVAQFGAMNDQHADAYVAEMTKQKRYCRDIY
jgi:sulfite reductase (NADPH) flavoprotein alpha-component